MIEFSCACGKSWKVAESAAGKRGKCKSCGASIQVPDIFDLIDVDPSPVKPSVPFQQPAPIPLPPPVLASYVQRSVAQSRRPETSIFGVISFTLGAVALVWAASEGYHPPAWSVAKLALFLGVVSFIGSLINRRTGLGWPALGILASLLGLGTCSGMEQRAIRAAYHEAYLQGVAEAKLAKERQDLAEQLQQGMQVIEVEMPENVDEPDVDEIMEDEDPGLDPIDE